MFVYFNSYGTKNSFVYVDWEQGGVYHEIALYTYDSNMSRQLQRKRGERKWLVTYTIDTMWAVEW